LVIPFICVLWSGTVSAQQTEPEEEGRQDQVWKLVFTGNDNFSSIVLAEQIATEAPTFWEKMSFWKDGGHPVDEIMIQKDAIRIRNFYQRRGFYDVRVTYRLEEMGKSWKQKLTFEVDERSAIRIANLEHAFQTRNGNVQSIRESIEYRRFKEQQPMRQGSRYEQIRIPEVVGQLRDVLRNLGYPYAEVDIDAEIDTASLAADVAVVANTGPQAAISEISVEGARSVSDRYVIRESGLKQGDRYSYEEVQKAQRELFNHHMFQFVTISIPEQEQDSTLNLLMRVREAQLRTVEASVGFGTEELARGQLRWIHRNAFQKGHQFTATGRASFIQQLVSMDYLFPYVYNNKSSFVISPFGEHQLEKSFELYTAGLTNSFIYQYQRNLTGTVSYQITKNRELSKQTDVTLPDSTIRYDLSSLQLSGYYSQGYGREQLGWVVQPYAEISGFFGFATFAFQKASIDVRRFTKLGESTTLATRVQAGGIVNASVDSLPRNIRFFLGGTNSVRGWLRQELGPKEAAFKTEIVEDPDAGQVDTVSTFDRYVPVGGRAMFAFNIELRQEFNKFIKGFGVAAFLDGGQIWRSVSTIGRRGIQFGTGAGLRYRSPIGPLRIDVGYKLNPTDQDLGLFDDQDRAGFWDKVGIHFSIGQAF